MDDNIPTIEEIMSLRKQIRRAKVKHQEELTKMDKLALFITERVGTMGFFFIISIWTVIWILWNTLGPEKLRFDPFPAFALWLFMSNIIQLILMPLLMVGQNLQGRYAELRAETDFEINQQSEKEIEVILRRLENHTKMLKEIKTYIDSVGKQK